MPGRSWGSVRIFYPEHDREEVVHLLRARLPALARRLPLRRAVLFGSYAQGNYTVASDIDLLVVYEGPRREEAYALVKRALALRGLEPHVYSAEEYEALRETLDRMAAGGLVLWEAS